MTMLTILFPALSKASAYWMEVIGSGKVNDAVTIRVIYGHIDEYSIRHRDGGNELTLAGDFKMSVIDDKGQKLDVPISRKADCWEGTFVPTHNGSYRILGINDSHPVVDRSKTGGKNVRPIDYLCADFLVGTAVPVLKPVQLLDILTTVQEGIVTVKAFNNNALAANGTKLRVFNPENWEKELTVNEKGEAVFKTTMPGLYIIRQDWEEAGAGNYKGIAYSNIRHRCNYSLMVK
ncbi:hypothetical protein GCM10023149_04930 [Mucilaginibacter gynuensis]|uniref:Uncharacterized protein n=2 Tax=Mucilaginibacter gynuensis TaxID=1302236 RepID=A0ABP8FSX0_9SPHI